MHSFDWLWDFDNGSNSTDENPSLDFGAYGTFDVMLTSNYCGNTDDTTITITIAAAGLDEDFEFFEIYPNPSENGIINIFANSPVLIEVYELSGRFVTKKNISISGEIKLETGVYLIKAGNSIKKLIVH